MYNFLDTLLSHTTLLTILFLAKLSEMCKICKIVHCRNKSVNHRNW